jgi:hypothetical protein
MVQRRQAHQPNENPGYRNAGAETLAHPEPGFFTLGIKSYGRRSDFLIQTGQKQVQTVLDSFHKN